MHAQPGDVMDLPDLPRNSQGHDRSPLLRDPGGGHRGLAVADAAVTDRDFASYEDPQPLSAQPSPHFDQQPAVDETAPAQADGARSTLLDGPRDEADVACTRVRWMSHTS